jgi:hypothetical protein
MNSINKSTEKNIELTKDAQCCRTGRYVDDQWEINNDSCYFGQVESISIDGINGWVAYGNISKLPHVILYIEGVKISSIRPSILREDIYLPGVNKIKSGFNFDIDNLMAALDSSFSPAAPIQFNIEGTDEFLKQAEKLTVADIKKYVNAKKININNFDGLPDLLKLNRLALLAPKIINDINPATLRFQISGAIEWVSVINDHVLMVGGWGPDEIDACCAVSVDDGAIVFASIISDRYYRSDLPSGQRGFIGVLQLNPAWNPSQNFPKISIEFYTSKKIEVRFANTIKAIKVEEAFSETEIRLGGSSKILGLAKKFLPESVDSLRQSSAIHVDIDMFDILPDFGIFISGWCMSSLGYIRKISVVTEKSRFHLDEETLNLSARPDLISAFPGFSNRYDRAGFSAILRGNIGGISFENLYLQIELDNGYISSAKINPEKICLIDKNYKFEKLIAEKFSILNSAWISDFLLAMNSRSARIPDSIVTEEDENSLSIICTLPENSRYIRVALDRLENLVSRIEKIKVNVFVFSPQINSSIIGSFMNPLGLLSDNVNVFVINLSVNDSKMQSLINLLSRLEKGNFVFVGPDVIIGENAHILIKNFIKEKVSKINFLPVQYFKGATVKIHHEFQAIAWNVPDFLSNSKLIFSPMGDFFEKNGLENIIDHVNFLEKDQVFASRTSEPDLQSVKNIINKLV